MDLPSLYKKSTTGALQIWTISTDENVIVTRWGVKDGKIQTAKDTIEEGKNIGKANETTPTGQAEFEAKSLWKKKKKKGYVENPKDALAGKVDGIIKGGIPPMLAHKFSERGSKIKYPAFAQPKLDGHRCLVTVKNGKASMWSRTRKPIPCLPHIVEQIESIVDEDCVFDGELYSHDYKDNFEELSSYIRQQKTPKEGYEVVEYWIYDFPCDAHFQERKEYLEEFFSYVPNDYALKPVETVPVPHEGHVSDLHDVYYEQGYEGLMLRNAEGGYDGKRSNNLQKVKNFDDAEFLVVDVKEGRGKFSGLAKLVCETGDGTKFSTTLNGSLESLKKYWKQPELAIGRMVTVRYQGFTSLEKVPRFPKALRFKDNL